LKIVTSLGNLNVKKNMNTYLKLAENLDTLYWENYHAYASTLQ